MWQGLSFRTNARWSFIQTLERGELGYALGRLLIGVSRSTLLAHQLELWETWGHFSFLLPNKYFFSNFSASACSTEHTSSFLIAVD